MYMLIIFFSLITCTIFIGGTITTIAYLFNYKCIMFNATMNNCDMTTFRLYGARLSLAVWRHLLAIFCCTYYFVLSLNNNTCLEGLHITVVIVRSWHLIWNSLTDVCKWIRTSLRVQWRICKLTRFSCEWITDLPSLTHFAWDSRISAYYHAHTPTRPRNEISRMAVNVAHILIICVKYPMCLRCIHNSPYIIT